MIRKKIVFILLIMSFSLQAKEYYLFSVSQKNKVEVLNIKGKEVSAKCMHKECIALKAKVMKVVKSPHTLRGNPNSKKCRNSGGAPIILLDANYNEYDFCRFSDESIVKSGNI